MAQLLSTSVSGNLSVSGTITSGGTAVSLNGHTHSQYLTAHQSLSNRLYTVYNHELAADTFNDTNYFMSGGNTGGSWSGMTYPSNAHNGMAVLSAHTHPGNYYSQLCLSTNDNTLWMRSANNESAFGNWIRLAKASEIPTNTNQLTNGAGYITGMASGWWNYGSTTWTAGNNVICDASGSSSSVEWSFDCTTKSGYDSYWHVWSGNNSKTILACYPKDNRVTIPNGNLTVSGSISEGGTSLADKYQAKGTYLTSHQSVSSSNNTASWGSAVTVGTVGGTDLKFTMPANPNTDHYAWSDITGKPAIAVTTTTSENPSAATANGFHYVTSSTNSTGASADANPFLQYHTSNSDFRIITSAYSDSWFQQIGTDFRTPWIYYRRKDNGNWQVWERIANFNSSQTGNFYATSFYAGSDRRLKDNIKKLDLDSLAIINSLKLKEFNFKTQTDKENKYIGLIAQDLRKVLPDKYKENIVSGNERLSINEGKLPYLTLGAVQQLSKKIDKLEKENSKLKEKNKDLEKRLLKLEKLVNKLL